MSRINRRLRAVETMSSHNRPRWDESDKEVVEALLGIRDAAEAIAAADPENTHQSLYNALVAFDKVNAA